MKLSLYDWIFVAFVEDNAAMNSKRYLEINVS